jgi:CheY-like chemotaxis protein
MTTASYVKSIDILLVEDNMGDADLAREALEGSKINNKLYVVGDGEAAMDFLNRSDGYAQMPRPDLILLDLNLPKKDGREVLADIKANKNLRCIPVVILTTSDAEEDVLNSYDLHANCYITKPIDMNQFVKVVQSIEDFWFSIVMLPPSGEQT